jgi:hypothetical protein
VYRVQFPPIQNPVKVRPSIPSLSVSKGIADKIMLGDEDTYEKIENLILRSIQKEKS